MQQNIPELSAAQRRVLVALCRPYVEGTSFASPASNRQIAVELTVTHDTVKTHLRTLFGVFDVAGLPQNEKRAALAREVLTRGIVTRRDFDLDPMRRVVPERDRAALPLEAKLGDRAG